MLAAYLLTAVVAPGLRVPDRHVRSWSVPVGFTAGVFQGGIGISGPVVGTWHHGLHLAQNAFVVSVATVFTLTGAAQVTVLGLRGELEGRLLVSLGLTAVMFVTLPLGARLRRRLSVDRFRTIVLVLLGVARQPGRRPGRPSVLSERRLTDRARSARRAAARTPRTRRSRRR
jgi:uncharacterized protein